MASLGYCLGQQSRAVLPLTSGFCSGIFQSRFLSLMNSGLSMFIEPYILKLFSDFNV